LSCPEASGRVGSHRPRVVDPPQAMEELQQHPDSRPSLGVTRMMSVTAVGPDAGRNRTLRPPHVHVPAHVHVRPMVPRSRTAGRRRGWRGGKRGLGPGQRSRGLEARREDDGNRWRRVAERVGRQRRQADRRPPGRRKRGRGERERGGFQRQAAHCEEGNHGDGNPPRDQNDGDGRFRSHFTSLIGELAPIT
jgi:hypothetical protein